MLHSHPTHALAAERRADLAAAAVRTRAARPRRRLGRRALLAAALAAAVVPAAAQAGTAVTESDRRVVVHGDDANTTVVLSVRGTVLRVVDPAGVFDADASDDCFRVTAIESNCSLSRIDRIGGFSAGGNDTWRVATELPTSIEGGDGNDTYHSAVTEGTSRVTFAGQAGSDEASYGSSSTGVTVTKDGAANDGRTGRDRDDIRGDVERLVGSSFGDSLNGSTSTTVDEVFTGGGGDDVLSGNAGANFYAMGSTADGADTINGGSGVDHVDYTQRTRSITATLNADDRNDGEAGEGDSLRSVESISGGQTGDTLTAPFGSRTGHAINGGGGADTLTGAEGRDTFFPGAGRDTVTANGEADVVFADADRESDVIGCGAGIDTAHVDTVDSVSGCEDRRVGVLRLTPGDVRAAAGAVARVTVRWRHPRSWRALESVALRLTDDGRPVGSITVDPGDGRMTGEGAVRPVRRASRITRRGRTASAHLALRLDPSLAGRVLDLEVEAVDRDGTRQLERAAGTLRVAG